MYTLTYTYKNTKEEQSNLSHHEKKHEKKERKKNQDFLTKHCNIISIFILDFTPSKYEHHKIIVHATVNRTPEK